MFYVWHYSNEIAGIFATKEEAFACLDEVKAYRVTFVWGA